MQNNINPADMCQRGQAHFSKWKTVTHPGIGDYACLPTRVKICPQPHISPPEVHLCTLYSQQRCITVVILPPKLYIRKLLRTENGQDQSGRI